MALIAVLRACRLSDPDGKQLVVDVSYLDDQQPLDVRTQDFPIVASTSLAFDPATVTKSMINQSVQDYGATVNAALGKTKQLVSQFPVGTRIPIT